MHSYQDTKLKALIHICILVPRRDVLKMTYTWMKFFQTVDLSNYIASCIQYFHIDKVIYYTIMTLTYKNGATRDSTHRQIKIYQQVISFMTSIFIICQQYPKSKTKFLPCIIFK